MNPLHLSNFLRGYLTAMLWSSTDDNSEPLDATYDVADIDKESVVSARELCAEFLHNNAEDVADYVGRIEVANPWDQAGHDLWLTSQGHGAGFWDRGLGDVGDRLTKAAKKPQYEGVYPFVLDGKVHI